MASCSFEEIFNIVLSRFDGDILKAEKWFNTPNILFGKMTPKSLIYHGRLRHLIKFILNTQDEIR